MRISRYDLETLMKRVGEYDHDNTIRDDFGWTGSAKCTGLIFSNQSLWFQFVVELTEWAVDGGDQVLIPDVEDVKRAVSCARLGDMGGDRVIAYWPYGGFTVYDA